MLSLQGNFSVNTAKLQQHVYETITRIFKKHGEHTAAFSMHEQESLFTVLALPSLRKPASGAPASAPNNTLTVRSADFCNGVAFFPRFPDGVQLCLFISARMQLWVEGSSWRCSIDG